MRNHERNKSKHTCETTKLLKDLKEDPIICLCQLNNTDFEKDSIENEFDATIQGDDIRCLNGSKQLFVFENAEGCMKSIEIHSGNPSDSSNACDFPTAHNPLQNYTTANGHKSHNQSLLNFSKNAAAQNTPQNNFVYGPGYGNTVGSYRDSRGNLNSSFVPQSYPQYTVNRTARKQFPSSKKSKASSKMKSKELAMEPGSSSASVQSGDEQSIPSTSTFLEKQSYTQFSVEEVHVAETSSGVYRPRRSTKIKTASEMLMLKRKIQKKIVQSTSFEFQSNKCRKSHTRHSNSELAVHGQDSEHNEFFRGNSLVRRRNVYSAELEKYGPEVQPPGWNVQVVRRKAGRSAGQIDVYFVTPEGKRLRSKAEVGTYIEQRGLSFLPDEFIFRKSAYKMLEGSAP